MSDALPVTVLIAARNEEKNIEQAIASVGWAEKVYVLDSHSSDATIELASRAGAEVVQFDYDGGWPKKRNWGLENLPISTPWVLLLDADERITDGLREEISTAIKVDDCNGYYLNWKFVFLGRWMKYSWRHGWMLRLFRHGKGKYEDLGMRGEGGWDTEVHENVVVEGVSRRLKEYLLHESNEDLSFWIAKQNEFSSWNAVRRVEQLKQPLPSILSLFAGDPVVVRKWMKAVYIRMPCQPVLYFCWLYFLRMGFLDGKEGYVFCRLRAIHEFNIRAKMFELRKK